MFFILNTTELSSSLNNEVLTLQSEIDTDRHTDMDKFTSCPNDLKVLI